MNPALRWFAPWVGRRSWSLHDPPDAGLWELRMHDALLVNPHSAEEISDALRRAVSMQKDERVRRWRNLIRLVDEQDVLWWLKRFTDALAEVPVAQAPA